MWSPRDPTHIFKWWGGGGGGGIRQRFIFYTQKDHNFRICPPKKITTLFSIPKKIPYSFFRNPKESLWFFFATQKNPGIFHRPKKITFGQHFRPKKITRNPPSLKYVSGAPGCEVYLPYSLWKNWFTCSIELSRVEVIKLNNQYTFLYILLSHTCTVNFLLSDLWFLVLVLAYTDYM